MRDQLESLPDVYPHYLVTPSLGDDEYRVSSVHSLTGDGTAVYAVIDLHLGCHMIAQLLENGAEAVCAFSGVRMFVHVREVASVRCLLSLEWEQQFTARLHAHNAVTSPSDTESDLFPGRGYE